MPAENFYDQNNRYDLVLVICGHNKGRSIISEGFINDILEREQDRFPLTAGTYRAVSAGTRPGEGGINPQVVQVMSEYGIDVSDPNVYFSKGVDSEPIKNLGGKIRKAIIVCDDECHFPPELTHLGKPIPWKIPDPHGQDLERVREIVGIAREKVYDFLGGLEIELRDAEGN